MNRSPEAVGPASRSSERRYADAPAAALIAGLTDGERLRFAPGVCHFFLEGALPQAVKATLKGALRAALTAFPAHCR